MANEKFEWATPIYLGAATPDFFESGDLLVKAEDINGLQYLRTGDELICTHNDPIINMDGVGMMEQLKHEQFKKVASVNPHLPAFDLTPIYRRSNELAMEMVSLPDEERQRLEKLNASDDLESVKMVTNILKTKYNVDIRE